MVDYAIALGPSPSLRQTLLAALDIESIITGAVQSQSVNQTAYPPLRLAPICVSIETKAPDGDQSQAKAQLAIWGAAHLRRLDCLRKACMARAGEEASSALAPALPCLPMILVVGAYWDLYFLKMNDEGEITMIGNQSLGDTETLLGAYRLLHGLRTIAGSAMKLESWWNELPIRNF